MVSRLCRSAEFTDQSLLIHAEPNDKPYIFGKLQKSSFCRILHFTILSFLEEVVKVLVAVAQEHWLCRSAEFAEQCVLPQNELGGEPYMAEKLWKSALSRILRFAILMSLWDLGKYLVSTAQSVNSTWESLSYFDIMPSLQGCQTIILFIRRC